MTLKQQVIFVSKASDGAIKYELPLVQALFLHVLETPFQDKAIGATLRPLLEKPSVTDEQLMEKMNQSMSEETECQSQMGVAKRGVKVNQVATSPTPSSDKAPQSECVNLQERKQSQIAWLPHWQYSLILHVLKRHLTKFMSLQKVEVTRDTDVLTHHFHSGVGMIHVSQQEWRGVNIASNVVQRITLQGGVGRDMCWEMRGGYTHGTGCSQRTQVPCLQVLG